MEAKEEDAIPVVIRADLIMEGVQEGRWALTKAAAPLTWGQDMDVPDANPNFGVDGLAVLGGGNAAKIKTPGAITSGWKKHTHTWAVIFYDIYKRLQWWILN